MDMALTPFGRRTLSLGLIATQQQARAVEPEKTVHQVEGLPGHYGGQGQARPAGPGDCRASCASVVPSGDDADGRRSADRLPSNEKLCARAHGIAPATLRRHLAALVEAGIVIRRDSPNGKRYARRGMDGEVSLAFGFELTPLVARAEEFEALAAEVQAERRALRLARERITLVRRDITKMILLGMEEALPGDWQGLHGQYLVLVGRLKRSASHADLEAIAVDLEDFSAEILKHLELFTNFRIQAPMSPIPSATNRIQNQTFTNLNLLSRKTGPTSASPILRPLVRLKPSREGRRGGRNRDIPPKPRHAAADGARGLPGYPRLHP